MESQKIRHEHATELLEIQAQNKSASLALEAQAEMANRAKTAELSQMQARYQLEMANQIGNLASRPSRQELEEAIASETNRIGSIAVDEAARQRSQYEKEVGRDV